MTFILGIIIAVVSLIAAVLELQQSAAHFWDFVAFACVTGGTLAVAVIIFPWQYRKDLIKAVLSVFKFGGQNNGYVAGECLKYIELIRSGSMKWDSKELGLWNEILSSGAELTSLGLNKDEVMVLLEDRIVQQFERTQKISNSFRSLAKYPPAFGLAGTVLGLVSLMRKVSEGADAKQTGLTMAIALMATFYGLLMANLIVAPLGEFLSKIAVDEKKSAEIALHSVQLALSHQSILTAQETLNSYLPKEQRLSVLGDLNSEVA
jgi:chemotaxis protein MotA